MEENKKRKIVVEKIKILKIINKIVKEASK
jgi:hypothetical protein